MKKYVLPLVLAVTAAVLLGAGVYCALTFATCFMDGGPADRPVAAPVSLLAGILCAVGLLGIVYGYVRLRKRYPSLWITVVDILTGLVLALLFFILLLKMGNLLWGV